MILYYLGHAGVAFGILGAAYLSVVGLPTRKQLPLPPAPAKPRLMFGHIDILPKEDEHIVYRDWSKKIGSDVIALKVLSHTLVMVNSSRAAYNLFSKKARKHSGRAYLPLVMDPLLLDWSGHTAFLPYGERWRQQRQLMRPSFSRSGISRFASILGNSARKTASQMLEQPGFDLRAEFTYMFGAQVLLYVYGYEVQSPEDRILKLVEGASAHLGKALLPNNFLVNIIPWLRYIPSWLPGGGWKNVVRDWGEELRNTVEEPYNFTVNEMALGTALPSVLGDMITNAQAGSGVITPEIQERIMWAAGSLYTAAIDSLVSTMQVFILAMVLHPDIQTKAQEEIDRITGGKRLPKSTDENDMTYLRCIILEVLRWQNVTPLGIPHRCDEEDMYEGCRIPKGALLFGNIWAINHDASIYDEPDSFIPERFLDPNTPEPSSFGFGRRKCPGMHFAHASLFIAVSTLLAVSNIHASQDDTGVDIIPKVEMIRGALA